MLRHTPQPLATATRETGDFTQSGWQRSLLVHRVGENPHALGYVGLHHQQPFPLETFAVYYINSCHCSILEASKRDLRQHVWAGEALGFAHCHVGGVNAFGVGDRLDVAVGVEVEVGAVDLEPHVGWFGVVVGHCERVL